MSLFVTMILGILVQAQTPTTGNIIAVVNSKSAIVQTTEGFFADSDKVHVTKSVCQGSRVKICRNINVVDAVVSKRISDKLVEIQYNDESSVQEGLRVSKE